MKVLVTGAAGYIGTELIKALQKKPELDIVAYDDISSGRRGLLLCPEINSQRVQFVKADILDTWTLEKTMKDIDFVFHLAAKTDTPFSSSHAHEFERVNQWGTEHVARIAVENHVKSLVNLSSISVYGSRENEISIKDEPAPETHYGISKFKAEAYVEWAGDKLENGACQIRCANVYGPGSSMRFEAVVNNMCFNAQYDKKIWVDGRGEQFRALVQIDEVVNALVSTLDQKKLGGTFNLVGRNLAIAEIAEKVQSLFSAVEVGFRSQAYPHRSIQALCCPEMKKFLNKTEFIDDLQQIRSLFWS